MAEISARKEPTQARSRATVDAILEASARILIREGYAALSTNRVAAAAGVSIGSLYQYFGGKEAIVGALLDRHAEAMLTLVTEHLSGRVEAPVEEVVRELIRAMIEAHRVEPELHRVFAEQIPMHVFTRMRDMEVRITELLEAALLARRGSIRALDPRLAAFILGRAVEAITHAATLDHPERLDEALVGELTLLVTRYLEPPR